MGDQPGPTPQTIREALQDVMDPELPISIVDMGLIYDVRVEDGAVDLDVTFTATACPCADFIVQDIHERLEKEPGVGDVNVHIVWDPPWTNDRLTPRGRELLRAFGVSA